MQKKGRGTGRIFDKRMITVIFMVLCMIYMTQTVMAAEPIKVSYYYEEVCASCDGTKDFFELYNQVISAEDKQQFDAEISTYNVFMESCKTQYEEVKKELQIPSGTSLPVLVIGDRWISGHEEMSRSMRDILLHYEEEDEEEDEQEIRQIESSIPNTSTETEDERNHRFWEQIKEEIETSELPAALLFSTNGCEDCHAVKEWISEQELPVQILEYNIIEDSCLNELKALFVQYQVPEEAQKVPILFYGDEYLTGKERIQTFQHVLEDGNVDHKRLQTMVAEAEISQSGRRDTDGMNLWTLAAAGLLAGVNPCSISMLLMLMSLLLSEKASIWKSGLLYLLGKYAAYLSIGFAIFATASQISEQTMDNISRVLNLVMGTVFAAAAILYLMDAIRVFRQDYGNIKMQLPVGLRRMNHNLIKKMASAGGILQPLMILLLGIVISFGEFFCTGQIYMASITYLLRDQVKAAVFPFLVYTTAMSIPAVIMILLIQRTRNTNAVSDFMFRHLGMIKLFNAVLFMLFAIYFLMF